MVNYQDWNNEIYNNFFNENTKGIRCLFYVDEKLLNTIGKNLGEEKPLESFCKCVLNEICEERGRNKGTYGFRVRNIEPIVKDNIPKQTALIAFFVYAATTMVDESGFSSNAYWGKKIKTIIKNYYHLSEDKIARNILQGNIEYQHCSELFEKFEEEINKQNFNIKFQKLYNRGVNDIVGRAISQAIITEKDRSILNRQFNKIRSCNSDDKLSYLDYAAIFRQNGYSKGFKKAKENNEIRNMLENHIEDLYKDFLKNGDDYEIIDTIYGKQRVISLKLRYYSDSNEFLFEFKQKKNFPEELEGYRKDRDIFYKYVEPEEISLYNKIYIEKGKIKYLQNDDTKEYMLLVAEEQGNYIENFSANVGDNVIIIASRMFFNKYQIELSEIFGKYIKEKPLVRNNESGLYIFSATCKYPNLNFNIKSGEAIQLLKGLKNGQKNEYLQNAGPILNINKSKQNDIKRKNTNGKVIIINNKNSSISYSIDNGVFQPYEIPVRLNDKQNGFHSVKVKHGSNKNYEIKYEFEERDQEFIYNYFQEGIYIKTNNNCEIPNLINGCYIENLSLSNRNCLINEDKNIYISNIIKAFNTRLNNPKLYNPQLYGLKQRYLKKLEA